MEPISFNQSNANWIKFPGASPSSTDLSNPQNRLVESNVAKEMDKAKEKVVLPTSLEELLKMQAEAMKEDEEERAELLRQQMARQASAEGLPPTGNVINVKA